MADRNILFIIPDEKKVYEGVNIKVGAYHLPSLAFAILGAVAKKSGFNPIILDLTFFDKHEDVLVEHLSRLDPVYVGITCTTALYYHARDIAGFIKKRASHIPILGGGPHVSSTAGETLANSDFDYIFIGEAEESFADFLEGADREKIKGLAFRNDDREVHLLPHSSFINDLNAIPYPDYSLYDLARYRISKIWTKNNPVVWIETSRGCPFDCKICNKIVHGQNFRPKSPERVVAEMEHLMKQGAREFFIADDGFTSQMDRAGRICDIIIEKGLDVTWSCTNGIRVDRVDYDLLAKMHRAGCHRLALGIESGNQGVLDELGKQITIEQIVDTAKMARKAGIEIHGFFMFGFKNDTEETMQETIDFARSLPLDFAKASLVIPFPGSPLNKEYKKMDLLLPVKDYRSYNFYTSPRHVYKHPTLGWDTIERYQDKFYRAFYINPRYIIRRLIKAIKNGVLFDTLISALRVGWFSKR